MYIVGPGLVTGLYGNNSLRRDTIKFKLCIQPRYIYIICYVCQIWFYYSNSSNYLIFDSKMALSYANLIKFNYTF